MQLNCPEEWSCNVLIKEKLESFFCFVNTPCLKQSSPFRGRGGGGGGGGGGVGLPTSRHFERRKLGEAVRFPPDRWHNKTNLQKF